MTDVVFRLIVTGSRSLTSSQAVWIRHHLDFLWAEIQIDRVQKPEKLIVVQGKCPQGGVDLVAEHWADATPGAESEGHPADWARYGRRAGPFRNAEMVALGGDLCVGFPGADSTGTWDCLKQAASAGIPGRFYPLPFGA